MSAEYGFIVLEKMTKKKTEMMKEMEKSDRALVPGNTHTRVGKA